MMVIRYHSSIIPRLIPASDLAYLSGNRRANYLSLAIILIGVAVFSEREIALSSNSVIGSMI